MIVMIIVDDGMGGSGGWIGVSGGWLLGGWMVLLVLWIFLVWQTTQIGVDSLKQNKCSYSCYSIYFTFHMKI